MTPHALPDEPLPPGPDSLRALPRDARLESTLALRRDPYGFIAATCRALDSDVFEARLLLRRTVCMSGPEAARLFHQGSLFERACAVAPAACTQRLAELAEQGWRRAARDWTCSARVELYTQARAILCRSACAWAGVPLREDEVALRAAQIGALDESDGPFGLVRWTTRLARWRAQRWAAGLVRAIRARTLPVAPECAAAQVALQRDARGALPGERRAALELLDLLRPTLGIAVNMVFVALALHEYPECARKLREDASGRYAHWFAQEVRRFYPFFPAAAARVRQGFTWNGYRFEAGRPVLLDVHGTNHDERAWVEPGEFLPERFAAWPFEAYPLADGGMALSLMAAFARFLARELAYELPPQDLRVDGARLPALPRSRFMMGNVRLRAVAPSNQKVPG